MKFNEFAAKVHERFVRMSMGELFVAGTSEDDIFAHYLASFPEGSNPIYKTRTEFDCSCCKNFIRNIGRAVRIKDGLVETIWSVDGLESPFKEVAEAMDIFVSELPITSLYRTKERQYGNEVTRQLLENKEVLQWHHFHGKIAAKHHCENPEQIKGEFISGAGVFKRGLEELQEEALQDIINLIEDEALYRGEEHLLTVKRFLAWHQEYRKLNSDVAKNLFIFSHAADPAVRFRNTVIGTLVQDLSAGVDMEVAVRSFETKVAPQNYKRTTALITPMMVKNAMNTINELGLLSALDRRLATLADVSVRDVLWVDRSAKGRMKGGIEDALMQVARRPSTSSIPTSTVEIDDFITHIMPSAQSIELALKNQHLSNLVAITAPVNPMVGLFRWGNSFAWSYAGDVADSIKERVKAAGGNINAKLRFSLAWFNHDDLDFHVKTPDNRHIYYGDKQLVLDVDMNAFGGLVRNPVENLSFTHPRDGVYTVWVNQFNKRESSGVGFTVEIASGNSVVQLSYAKGLRQKEDISVGTFTVKNGEIVKSEYGSAMVGTGIPQVKWGLTTESLVKVQTIMLSPNHWDGNSVGNKHYFFLVDGCKTDVPVRGIYNEFLSGELEKHRKVFEVLGDKTKCPVTGDQLSGLGFSSTRKDSIGVTVTSKKSVRTYNLQF